MYIDFDEYPRYSGRNSEIFEKYVNENIKCKHDYAYSSGKHNMCKWVNEDNWKIMKNCFPGANQIKKCPRTVSCKKCTYVQKYKNGKDEMIDPPAYTEQTFYSSYFIKEPNYTVESIEVRLNEINTKRLKNKREKWLLKNKMTRTSELMREKWQHAQMALLLMIWRKV